MAGKSTFTEKVGNEICFQIIDGLSLRSICAQEGMPPLRTLMDWISRSESFSQQYTQARRIQADIKFDDLKDLAKTATPEDIQCVKLQIDTAKWELSKTLPKKYGDKLDLGLNGKLEITGAPVISFADTTKKDD